MAQPNANLIETLIQSDGGRFAEEMSARLNERIYAAITLSEALGEVEYDNETLATILLTSINGGVALKEQTVEVEYLRVDQKLLIPLGLGMNPFADGITRTTRIAVLIDRYWKLTRMTYDTMKRLASANATAAEVLEAVNELDGTPRAEAFTAWSVTPANELLPADPKGTVDLVYMFIAKRCQFNYDFRDTGVLLREDMNVTDTMWRLTGEAALNPARLDLKVHAFTLQQIAGLNYDRCANMPFAAWIRAYGVGCGVLPHTTSRTLVEYQWTSQFAPAEAVRSVGAWEKRVQRPIKQICLNAIAMFGLFHLNKDHTFKSNDANMDRICTSWLNTLRTITPEPLQQEILANKEVICRTAAHPFGLAQTYWLARLMGRLNMLAAPLALRVDVTPPPIQRVMICDAAIRNWAALPGGQMINQIYGKQVDAIIDMATTIKGDPPSYTGLHNLYGVTTGAGLTDNAKAAIDALMPIVVGYAEAVFGEDYNDGNRKSMALAQSVKNVKNDNAAVTGVWTNIWVRYLDNMDKGGIHDFAKAAMDTFNLTVGASTMTA